MFKNIEENIFLYLKSNSIKKPLTVRGFFMLLLLFQTIQYKI